MTESNEFEINGKNPHISPRFHQNTFHSNTKMSLIENKGNGRFPSIQRSNRRRDATSVNRLASSKPTDDKKGVKKSFKIKNNLSLADNGSAFLDNPHRPMFDVESPKNYKFASAIINSNLQNSNTRAIELNNEIDKTRTQALTSKCSQDKIPTQDTKASQIRSRRTSEQQNIFNDQFDSNNILNKSVDVNTSTVVPPENNDINRLRKSSIDCHLQKRKKQMNISQQALKNLLINTSQLAKLQEKYKDNQTLQLYMHQPTIRK